MRPNPSSASIDDRDPGSRSEPVIEYEVQSFLIELRAIPRSALEIKEAAGEAFEQIKLRPEYLGATGAQLATLYLAIEYAIVAASMKHQASNRAMQSVKQEFAKIGRALKNLAKD